MAILVVDDEPNFSRILEAKLRKSSFDVIVARNAGDALLALLGGPFDLVLLDLRLPDSDGLALFAAIRAITTSTPVIAMTAYEEVGLQERVEHAGASGILFKPFDLEELVRTVRIHIARARARPRPPLPHVPWHGAAKGAACLAAILDVDGPGSPTEVRIVGETASTLLIDGIPEGLAAAGDQMEIRCTEEDGVYSFEAQVLSRAAASSVEVTRPDSVSRTQ